MSSHPTLTIAKREWNAYFHSPVAYVFMMTFLGLMGFFTFNLSNFFQRNNAELAQSFFTWHPWLFLVLVPAVSMKAWAEERRIHTIELLFTLPCTILQAVLGKFLAGWLFLGLCLALTFPAVITVAYLGDPDLSAILAGYVGSFLLAGAYLSVGMLSSALTKNQVISLIIAVVIGLFLILAGFPPVTNYLAGVAPKPVVDFVAAFSFMGHFEEMKKGVVDFRDVLYFFSMMGVMLLATQTVLSHKAAR
jgi:ABC-2 type transport system permease protein